MLCAAIAAKFIPNKHIALSDMNRQGDHYFCFLFPVR